MAGTKAGGLLAAKRNKEKYGENFYKDIGSQGGKKGTTGGFHYAKLHLSEDDPGHPANAGRKGGYISRRGKHEVGRI